MSHRSLSVGKRNLLLLVWIAVTPLRDTGGQRDTSVDRARREYGHICRESVESGCYAS